jgi:hypothetical protein
MENKLTLEQTAHYLPYMVKVQWLRTEDNSYQISEFNFCDAYWLFKRAEFKLILHPLSDLTKHCEDLGFVPMDMLNYKPTIKHVAYYNFCYKDLESISYKSFIQLLKWHFDVFGLIEKNLAIDINTLKDGK